MRFIYGLILGISLAQFQLGKVTTAHVYPMTINFFGREYVWEVKKNESKLTYLVENREVSREEFYFDLDITLLLYGKNEWRKDYRK